jgi:hybrid cluster-associated redox disulfide protein
LVFSSLLIERKATMMPTDEMTVAEVLEKWPGTVSVFQELKTACVGCAMAPYDTLADVARIYDMDLRGIMTALQDAASVE